MEKYSYDIQEENGVYKFSKIISRDYGFSTAFYLEENFDEKNKKEILKIIAKDLGVEI